MRCEKHNATSTLLTGLPIYATVGAEWGVTSPPTRIAHAHGWRTLSAFNRIVPSPSIHSFAQDLLELFNFWNDVFVANPLNDAAGSVVDFLPTTTRTRVQRESVIK
jgi:hypothetical protein